MQRRIRHRHQKRGDLTEHAVSTQLFLYSQINACSYALFRCIRLSGTAHSPRHLNGGNRGCKLGKVTEYAPNCSCLLDAKFNLLRPLGPTRDA